MSIIAIVSAGAFGTALAKVLAQNNHEIRLHVLKTEIDTYQLIKKTGVNATYLSGVSLDMNWIHPKIDLADAVRGAEFILLTIPAQYARQTIGTLKPYLEPTATVILTSKGLIEDGAQLSEIVAQELPNNRVCGIYGIMFAKLICLSNGFSSMCIASPDKDVSETVANLFISDNSNKFRIYLSDDLLGAEFGGAMKNVYAIAMGIFDGYFEVTKSTLSADEMFWVKTSRHSLLNLCMMEFVEFGLCHGARIHTLLGPSGIGDIQAGADESSRNYKFGHWFAQLDIINKPEPPPKLHEGFDTVRAAMKLSEKYSLDMPILKATYDILFNDKNITEVVPSLLSILGVKVKATNENKFNTGIKASINMPRILKRVIEKQRKTAFISYRFSEEAEKYMMVIKSICDLHNINVSTGTTDGPIPPKLTIPNIIQEKIKVANLYIAIFLNDKVDSTWLIEEMALAISANIPMLIFVEKGTPLKKMGKMSQSIPHHEFTIGTFTQIISKQLNHFTLK